MHDLSARAYEHASPPGGKHEFVVLQDPVRASEVEISCADFRHGYDYEYRLIGWVDPRADEFRIDFVATAANLYGSVESAVTIAKTVTQISVSDLVDLQTLRFRQPTEIIQLLVAENYDYSRFEFAGSDGDR